MHKKDVIQCIVKKFGFVLTPNPISLLIVLIFVLLLSQTSRAAILRVGAGKPYTTIQSAIKKATEGDKVLVYEGTYRERINFLGKAITVRSVRGAAKTIIDGNGKGSVVSFKSGEGSGSVLRGFTITNGTGTRAEGSAYGGGIYCPGSSPSIKDCTISGNSADIGGGIYCKSSTVFITSCTINNNTVTGSGGGIYCLESTPLIKDCIFNDNSCTQGSGGAMCCDSSSASIENCTMKGNSAWQGGGIASYESLDSITNCIIIDNEGNFGGGIMCQSWSSFSPSITDCIITDNTGDGIYCLKSSPLITNCTISRNYGTGIVLTDNFSSIINCTITRNSTGVQCAGIMCFRSSPSIVNCTLNGNRAGHHAGAIYCEQDSFLRVINSILWGDTAGGIPSEIFLDESSSIMISYSDIEEGWTGTGNIDTDPLFVGNGDYHLTADSPCIDTGTSEGAPSDDIDGDTRPQGQGYDMGADEFVPD
jgi:parallel beta-helix repeat protein